MVVLPARHDLAAMIGTVREVATRALRQLQRLGVISWSRGDASAFSIDRPLLDQLAGILPAASLSSRRRGR